MTGESMLRVIRISAAGIDHTSADDRIRRLAAVAGCRHGYAGIGNTGFADANVAGKITWMSLPSTCVLTGAAPWFWPLTNLVGP